LDRQVDELEGQIQAWHRNNPVSRKLAQIPGIGPLSASALTAAIGDAKTFKNGRQLAAWLGLVPRHRGTGGKQVLLGISKHGEAYLRTLVIHGSRSAILAAQRRAETDSWLARLMQRRHPNVAAVALANKNVRTVWALLAHDREYQADYAAAA
jgi:transposase